MRPYLAVVTALCAVPASAFGPPRQAPPGGCALVVSGPPRSSLFDHANRAFGGAPVPFSQDTTCITYDAVNSAFEQVRNMLVRLFFLQLTTIA